MRKQFFIKTTAILGLTFMLLRVSIAQELKIVTLDIGQGSSNYLEVYGEKGVRSLKESRVLIDAGDRKNDVIENLKSYLYPAITDPDGYEKTISLTIATHYDRDHIGGFVGTNTVAGVLKDVQDDSDFVIRNIWDLGDNSLPGADKPIARTYQGLANATTANRRTPSPGEIYQMYRKLIGDDLLVIEIIVLASNGNTFDGVSLSSNKRNKNDISIVTLTRVKCIPKTGDEQILFTYLNLGDFGSRLKYKRPNDDAEYEAPTTSGDKITGVEYSNVGAKILEKLRLYAGGDHICAMSASHHGANNSFFPTENYTIGTVLISSGNNTRYQHPRFDALSFFVGTGIAGSVIITGNDYFHRMDGRNMGNNRKIHSLKECYGDDVDVYFCPTDVRSITATNDPRHLQLTAKYKGSCELEVQVSRLDASFNTILGQTWDVCNH